MGALELGGEFARVEIFTNLRQALFEFMHGLADILPVGNGDVSPHGIWRAGNARQFTERSASNIEQWRIRAKFINQGGGQCSGNHLRQMADPGAKPVMIEGIQDGNPSAHFLGAVNELAALSGMRVLTWKWRKEPASAFEQIGVGEFDAGVLFACHRMAGEKSLSRRSSESFGGTSDDFGFSAAYVGDKGARWKRGAEAINQIENRDHRCSEDDEIATMDCISRISFALLNRPTIECALKNRRTITADDTAREMPFPEREAERASDQPGADDGDLFEGHAKLLAASR